MSDRSEEEIALLLDKCIDSLLSGEDWEAELPADGPDRAELVALMQIAEQLVDSLESDVETEPSARGPRRPRQALWDEIRDEVQRHRSRFGAPTWGSPVREG